MVPATLGVLVDESYTSRTSLRAPKHRFRAGKVIKEGKSASTWAVAQTANKYERNHDEQIRQYRRRYSRRDLVPGAAVGAGVRAGRTALISVALNVLIITALLSTVLNVLTTEAGLAVGAREA